MEKSSCSLNVAFEQFLAEKELFCTPKTVAGYRSSIGQFVDFGKELVDSDQIRRAIIDYLRTKRVSISDLQPAHLLACPANLQPVAGSRGVDRVHHTSCNQGSSNRHQALLPGQNQGGHQ